MLAISTPLQWGVNDEEKNYWSALKEKKGFCCLDVESRHSLYDKLPSLRELYILLEAIEKENLEFPIGRIGNSEEIAEMVYFLAAKSTNFTTGSLFKIDGGYTAG